MSNLKGGLFIVPVFAIEEAWAELEKLNLIEKTIAKGGGLHTGKAIKENVTSGAWGLWIISSNTGEIAGYFITNIALVGELKVFQVLYGAVSPQHQHSGLFIDSLEYIKSVARFIGCDHVLLESKREGYEQVVRNAGFHKHSVLYICDL